MTVYIVDKYSLAIDKAHREIFWASNEGPRVAGAAIKAAANVCNKRPDHEVSKLRAEAFFFAIILLACGWPS